MNQTQLLKYTQSIISDDYAMSVLYYSIRKAIIDNNFTLLNLDLIKISKKFIQDDTYIYIGNRFSSQLESFALLLSIRALILHKEWIEYCNDDSLLFSSMHANKFGWIEYGSYILECISDDDFRALFFFLEDIYVDGELSDKDKFEFENETCIPEFRNIINYYKDVAATRSGATSEVICNNAFVCDDSLTEYNVPESVCYVGNTAFAYCSNLTTIRFNNNKVLLGKFPIVECEKLTNILVPEGSESYFKEYLPYYRDIIFTDNSWNALKESESENHEGYKPRVEQIFKDNKDDLKTESNIAEPFDYKSLKHIFDKKVTTYKYFWFLSIISLINEKHELTLSFDALVIRMASIAWPLVFVDNLDFGSQDMMRSYLSEIKKKTTLLSNASPKIVEAYLRNNYDKKYIHKNLAPLLKNVPYRFLSPWIKYVSDDDVIAKSNTNSYNGLYALRDKNIIMDEDWFEYINDNYDDVYKFAKESFISYLKQYNNPLNLLRFIAEQK